jgi:hypothetical protein
MQNEGDMVKFVSLNKDGVGIRWVKINSLWGWRTEDERLLFIFTKSKIVKINSLWGWRTEDWRRNGYCLFLLNRRL